MQNAIILSFDETIQIAQALSKSGLFPDLKNENQAIAKVLAGREMGIPPFASITGIHIVQGKAVVGANLMATMVANHPRYDYKVITLTDDECTLVFHENGTEVGKSSFTMAEAKRAGLTGKDNWNKYPRNMLFARALSNGVKWFAPGVFGGAPVYTPDEFGYETDPEGDIIEAQAKDVEPVQSQNGKDGDVPDWIAAGNGELHNPPTETEERGKFTREAAIETGLFDNGASFASVWNRSPFTRRGRHTDADQWAWFTQYRAARDEGLSADEAIARANNFLAKVDE